MHTKLGRCFKEVVYKDALEIEFKKNGIPYEREKPFRIVYEEEILRSRFNADFFLVDSIILEIIASSSLHLDNFKQTLNYLKASQIQLGLLLNFGEERLNYQRVVFTY